MKKMALTAAATAALLGSFLTPTPTPRTWTPPKPPFDPKINRWTGKPHEHKREIARRKGRKSA